MRTFGAEIDNIIDEELAAGSPKYDVKWYQNGALKDINVTKATVHFMNSQLPFGNIVKDYISFETDYMGFYEGDTVQMDLVKSDAAVTAGPFYISDIEKGEFNASYTAYSSLLELDKINLSSVDTEERKAIFEDAKTIGELVHMFMDPLGIAFYTEPVCALHFMYYYEGFENMTLAQIVSFCGILEGCNYVLRGTVLYPIYFSSEICKIYETGEMVYSDNIKQKKTDTYIDHLTVFYRRWAYEYDAVEDPMMAYQVEFTDEEYIVNRDSANCGIDVNMLLVCTDSGALKDHFYNILNEIYGSDYNSYQVSMLGDARLQAGDKVKFDGFPSATFNISELIWEWDGGLKCTLSSCGTESGTEISEGISANEVAAQIKAMANTLQNIRYNVIYAKELNAEIAKLGYANISELETEVAKMGLLTVSQADIRYATVNTLQALSGDIDILASKAVTTDNLGASVAKLGYATISSLETATARISSLEANAISVSTLEATFARIDMANVSKAAVGTLFADIGLITSANIVDGHVTGYLDSVEINANKITAGTLSVDRLVIRGTAESLVYELNSITGALQAASTITLNGEILTDRTINCDKIVAGSITANELNIETITGSKAFLTSLTSKEAFITSLTAQEAFVNAISTNSVVVGAATNAGTALSNAKSAVTTANAVSTTVSGWKYGNTTYINGGKIYTGTIKAAQIDVNNLFAQNITATGTITGATLIGTDVTAKSFKLSFEGAETVKFTSHAVNHWGYTYDAVCMDMVSEKYDTISFGTMGAVTDGYYPTMSITKNTHQETGTENTGLILCSGKLVARNDTTFYGKALFSGSAHTATIQNGYGYFENVSSKNYNMETVGALAQLAWESLGLKLDASKLVWTITNIICSGNGVNVNVTSIFGKNVQCVLSVFGWGNYYRPSFSVIDASSTQYMISLHDPTPAVQNYYGQQLVIGIFAMLA